MPRVIKRRGRRLDVINAFKLGQALAKLDLLRLAAPKIMCTTPARGPYSVGQTIVDG